MPKGETDVQKYLWTSGSFYHNTEHLFFKLPDKSTEYEFWVMQHGATKTPYAVAWWAAGASAPAAKPGKVKGLAWADANADGVRASGEAPVAYARVDLYDTAGSWIDTTTTDPDGTYEFANVDNGTYRVEITSPVGYQLTTPNAGSDDAIDSDFDPLTSQTAIITVADDEHLNVDAGLAAHAAASIGDAVWLDANGNGLRDSGETGVENAVVYLHEADGDLVDHTTSNASGAYSFAAVRPGQYYLRFEAPYDHVFTTANVGADDAVDSDADPATGQTAVFTVTSGQSLSTMDAGLVAVPYYTIGDRVWNDANSNGLQDAGELGVSGVIVRLYNSAGALVGTTMTDASGNYLFSRVAAGDYSVRFEFLAGYDFTAQDQGGNDAVDSDADAAGQTAVFTVASAASVTSVDAGMIYGVDEDVSRLGDLVWHDLDLDGVQDANEPGVFGVWVDLFNSAGTRIATTTTNPDGAYNFYGVPAGSYYLQYLPPSGYLYTLQDQGTDTTDSDVNPNTGRTAVFTFLGTGTAGHHDAGLRTGTGPSVVGRVWEDMTPNGLQGDTSEFGLEDYLVLLINTSGDVIAATWTGTDGLYQFQSVAPGTYRVQVVPGTGFGGYFTPKDQGNDDAIDNDFNADGMTDEFDLLPTDTLWDFDAGLVPIYEV